MNEMALGRQVLYGQEKTRTGVVHKGQNLAGGRQEFCPPAPLFSGSESRGHVLGVGGRLGGSEA